MINEFMKEMSNKETASKVHMLYITCSRVKQKL